MLTFSKTDGSGTTYAWGASWNRQQQWMDIYFRFLYPYRKWHTYRTSAVRRRCAFRTSYYNIYLDDVNVFGQVPGVAGPNATGLVNFTVTHQTLEGFGAAGALV